MNLRLSSGIGPTGQLQLYAASLSAVLLGCALAVLSGCSSGGHHPSACVDDECGMDASAATSSPLDAGKRDSAIKPGNFVISDAGASGDLQARLVVNGGGGACGSCAVMVVQTQGGKPPYTYAWSDPSLSGSSAQVCPTASTDYSVIVTDNSASGVGEFSMQAMQVEVQGKVSCDPDAGAPSGDLEGCITPTPTPNDGGVDAGDAGAYGSGVQCDDAGVAFDLLNGTTGDVTVSAKIDGAYTNFSTFKAGKTYTYVADRFLPIVLSVDKPVLVDVYGATMPCVPAEKLFTLTYDLFTWHQAHCFTPKQDYAYLIVAVHLNGVVFFYDLFEAATICSGCVQQ